MAADASPRILPWWWWWSSFFSSTVIEIYSRLWTFFFTRLGFAGLLIIAPDDEYFAIVGRKLLLFLMVFPMMMLRARDLLPRNGRLGSWATADKVWMQNKIKESSTCFWLYFGSLSPPRTECARQKKVKGTLADANPNVVLEILIRMCVGTSKRVKLTKHERMQVSCSRHCCTD
jgi:hypothetical protein